MGSVSGGPIGRGGMSWSDSGSLAFDLGWDMLVADQSVQEGCPGVMVGHWLLLIWDGIGQ